MKKLIIFALKTLIVGIIIMVPFYMVALMEKYPVVTLVVVIITVVLIIQEIREELSYLE